MRMLLIKCQLQAWECKSRMGLPADPIIVVKVGRTFMNVAVSQERAHRRQEWQGVLQQYKCSSQGTLLVLLRPAKLVATRGIGTTVAYHVTYHP